MLRPHGNCPCCNKYKELTAHHKFPQSKINLKIYGELIHDYRNIQHICLDCHLSKAKGIIIWNELAFVQALDIELRSKSSQYWSHNAK